MVLVFFYSEKDFKARLAIWTEVAIKKGKWTSGEFAGIEDSLPYIHPSIYPYPVRALLLFPKECLMYGYLCLCRLGASAKGFHCKTSRIEHPPASKQGMTLEPTAQKRMKEREWGSLYHCKPGSSRLSMWRCGRECMCPRHAAQRISRRLHTTQHTRLAGVSDFCLLYHVTHQPRPSHCTLLVVLVPIILLDVFHF